MNLKLVCFSGRLILVSFIFSCVQTLPINHFPQLNRVEKNVVRELNLARTNPGKYALYLEQQKAFYVGMYIKRPGDPIIQTEEGVVALNEAIQFFKPCA